MKTPFRTALATLALLCGLGSAHSARAATAAEMLAQWNAQILAAAEKEDHFLTLKGVRAAALAHLAIHDALNSIEPRFRPYAFSSEGRGANPLAAMSAAAHAVAVAEYPAQRAAWDELLRRCLESIEPKAAREKGVALGAAAAAAILARRANDGWNNPATYKFQPMAPGVYAEFNEHSRTPQGFVFGAGWALAQPFALRAPSQFRSPPPPAITSAQYTRAFDEVREVGRSQSRTRTADQTHMAMWWKDFAESSHNRLARNLVVAEQTDLWTAARLFALLNVSVMDAYISVFDNKFFYNHWRPYTAIRWAEHDGNPDTHAEENWNNTHRHTYAFPSYPSAHGTACAAAMKVFAAVYGDLHYFKMSTPQVDSAGPMSPKIAMKPPTRSFDRFSDAAMECALSRVYLGIHFRHDSVEGNRLGNRIGEYISANFLVARGQGIAGNWQRASLGDVELEYQLRGRGEPVVFVHAGLFANWFEPLLAQPALLTRHQLLTYHRAGYAGSSRASGEVSIARQAAQLRALLDRLGLQRVHVVGHSSGGLIALQLALDDPGRVQSLALLEPALPIAGLASPGIAAAMQRYNAGDRSGAIDLFMRTVAGANYRDALERALPRARVQGMAAADTFFAQELPAVRAWTFSRTDAQRIHVPVLAVLGARSDEVSPIWRARQQFLLASLPDAQPFELPNATHLLHLQNTRGMAAALARFFATSRQRLPRCRTHSSMPASACGTPDNARS